MLEKHNLANAIRALSMDAVQRANSGHPGAPMGMADIAEVLWNDFLKHNPNNPNWDNRDRFVMSNGHGSMLIYALLHLSGYDLPMEEIKNFRQLHSKTPGHPEYGYAPGIETTTGPLGQGLANAVGMALAESVLSAKFNRDDLDIINHHTYVTVGDGCLMEGVSHESCSLAGTLGLGKLVAIYDSNQISIDGDVAGWFTEDIPKRFESYGWHVVRDIDGHNPKEIKRALESAIKNTSQPSILCCNTVIGWGSPNKAGKESSHGAPLGDEEIQLTRKELGWEHEPFDIPDEYYAAWDAKPNGEKLESAWQKKLLSYEKKYPELAAEYKRRMQNEFPSNWSDVVDRYLNSTVEKAESLATRKASQNAIEAYAKHLPEMIGGSADLTGSNLTNWSGSIMIDRKNKDGNYISYGVREFAMAAINNGISLHKGFIPYSGTFLMFSEYARNALRMAALMKIQNIFVFTHDSIGLGEDGPTHQAVEQASTLRLMPNMSLWRPCDAVESAIAWQAAIERDSGPTSLLLSRQNLAHLKRTESQLQNIKRGGYTLIEGSQKPEAIIIATGSEVEMALNVATRLNANNKNIRVVSMPSADVFDAQEEGYKETVLPFSCRNRIAIEAGVTDYWKKYTGLDGLALGVDTFGESAPAKKVFEHFGLTENSLEKTIINFLEQKKK
jgi:transketolase|tara:strand:+ start:1836 stop:3845 length:2010 start_codon:yes stop_codon:yes gene_type:complete